MAYNLIPCDRDQQFLMPPSLDDWLPKDHLARFVVDVVAMLDLSRFYARRREDGWGRAAYDPKMMVALLIYAYATGTRSSRKIEARLTEDIAFRFIAANESPDHATIARFAKDHEEELADLFDQVLRLAAEVGLVKVGLVALDSTRMQADASPGPTTAGTGSAPRSKRSSKRRGRPTTKRTDAWVRRRATTSLKSSSNPTAGSPGCAPPRPGSMTTRPDARPPTRPSYEPERSTRPAPARA